MNSAFFSDALLQQKFNDEGIVQLDFLNEKEISELQSYYRDTFVNSNKRNFHSTMFINDREYRKKVNEKIQSVLLQKTKSVLKNYRMLFSNFIVKEPSEETRVGIHQDWNFTSSEHVSINIWIPLVAINEKTGLFHALKGSHRSFHNIRFTPYEENAYAGLEEYILNNSTPYSIEAGTALIYHGALVHYSDKNASHQQRIAVGAALIPENAPNLHYYKRDNALEVYEVNEAFYYDFDFYNEPKGVRKVSEIDKYAGLPLASELSSMK